jgi:hypothetical protein
VSELAKQLFAGLNAVKDGLQSGIQEGAARALTEIGAEAKRLGAQGSMELASALFNEHAFVPYGPGQYTETPEQQQQPEQDRGMER